MMKKWSKRLIGFLVLLVLMNLAVGWFIRLFAPDFASTLGSWFNSSGVEDSLDLLVDFTFLTALVISLVISILIVRFKRHRV
ncbi:hypothetical protein [Serratia sp. M24T3]|uniref:hypothetical protein n=1 Tax=Serratia sp. M24T3 TaxID=932213 RepID=UPI00025B98F6|nr:hypothetical protein [Serratia sp. M24T3]EIC84094.1 hypothetical protein SPM24T3_13251 [Serratia sp. M24T3]